jgi:hypothetical protein
MVQVAFDNVLCGPPRKILFGAAVTNEVETYSPAVAMPLIRSAIIDASTLALDTALLDGTSADATRPAGLLENIADLGAQGGGGLVALTTDLAKILGAMSDASLNTEDVIFLMNTRQKVVATGLLPGLAASYTVVGSSAISSGTVIAVAPSAVAMFIGQPQIETSKEGLVRMATDPHDNIDTAAVSETVKSAWQAGLLLLKLRLRCTWKPLADAAIQKITSTTW